MLNFLEYLNEARKKKDGPTSATSDLKSDDKGKLFELLFAKHLGHTGKLPEHFRSNSENGEYAGTPEEVHDRLRAKVGPDAYDEINGHARNSAIQFKRHLSEKGHLNRENSLGNVHWTSNADKPTTEGDHEKLTGIKDVNSKADVMITKRDKNNNTTGYVGISAKYGKTKKPNYNNPGLANMEEHANAKPGEYFDIMKKHYARMEKLGYTGTADSRHNQYKNDVEAGKKGDTEAAKRAKAAEDSSLAARSEIAKRYARGLNARGDAYLRDHIRRAVSPQTVYPHYIVHARVNPDGSATTHIHDMTSAADEHLNQFSDLTAEHDGGMSVPIMGTHKKTGQRTRVALLGVKSVSGPHKNTVGTVTL